jgi:hypothetical protein
MNNRLIKSNDAGGGGCTNTVDLYNPFPDGGGVALYQLNGDATDVSGNYNGTATNVTYGAGEFGQAGLFSTSTSKVLLPQTYGAEGETFSYSFWFNTTTNGTNVYDSQFIINKRNGANTFQINITNGGKLLVSDWRGTPLNAQSTTTVTDGTWRNVVFTYDNSIGKVYINGVQETSMNFTNDLATQSITNGNCLGNFDQNSRVFSGSLDQVRVFSRALRPYEIEALYTEEYCTPTIVPSEHFNTVTYTGNGGTQSITGVGFQPDFSWIKVRATGTHQLTDSVRGVTKNLFSNQTLAEYTETNTIQSFDSDGFTLGSEGRSNGNGFDFVAWNFKAGGSAVTNTDGTITSQVSANTEAGFSIVSYTGNQTSGATVGHGLAQKPDFIISKSRGNVNGWPVYHKSIGATQYLRLNQTTQAQSSVFPWNNTEPNSNVFTLNNNDENNTSGQPIIAYCFAEVEGFSNFGSYVGNGSTTNVVIGFEPAFLIVRRTDSGDNWLVFDNKRSPSSPVNLALVPNNSAAEEIGNLGDGFTFLENGFNVVSTDSGVNANGGSYLYMAFAADPTTIEPSLEDSFNTVTYTGNSTTNAITGVGFQPDFVWIKNRTNANSHILVDSVRGNNSFLESDGTGAESIRANEEFASFDPNGFTLQTNYIATNNSSYDYVAWAWKGAELPAINSNGSIPSVVSANPAAGFSIVSYTGNGLAVDNTIGHGLNLVPKMIIIKQRSGTTPWIVYHSEVGTGDHMELNQYYAASGTGSMFGYPTDVGVAPTDSVYTVGASSSVNASSQSFIAYCFAEVAGFSKFGSYVGGTANNPITLGFEPAFVMIKSYAGVAENWAMYDNKRSPSNPVNDILVANESFAESVDNVNQVINFDANGFTLVTTNSATNLSGASYVYMAFANQF